MSYGGGTYCVWIRLVKIITALMNQLKRTRDWGVRDTILTVDSLIKKAQFDGFTNCQLDRSIIRAWKHIYLNVVGRVRVQIALINDK